MTVRILGIGWATPLGRDRDAVWSAIRRGDAPSPGRLTNPFNQCEFPVFRVDPATVGDVARLPRLRRSSAISHFSMAAAKDALASAGCDPAPGRLALVFAVTNGGVIYTRRFFEEVSRSGTHAGSPLLFPETVYNAPASHIAAALGITGIATTIVNDATAGIDAIAAACELLESGACDRCLVVAAEEADWTICEGYKAWRLAADAPPIVPFGGGGTIFGEGAAALLLGADGGGAIVGQVHQGAAFRNPAEARHLLAACGGTAARIVVSAASGTKFDAAEADLRAAEIHIAPKVSLGEAFAASTVMQVACAALALENCAAGTLAFVPAVGLQGQVAAVTLRA